MASGEGEGEATYSDEEFAELLGFLSDAKLEVQRFAAEGVLAQTESQAFLDYCRRQPRKAARPLLRLAEKADANAAAGSVAAAAAAAGGGAAGEKAARQAATEAAQASAAGASALQALVNISGVPSVRDELVELSAPRRAAEAMRGGWLEGRSGFAHWYSMLLANLTTSKAGQEAVCADESLFGFLFAAFISKPRPPPRDGYEDPLLFLGKVLCNACALEVGRRLLAGGEQGAGTVAALSAELLDRGRRADVVAILRNLSLDTECHAAVIGGEAFVHMTRFLYPWDRADAAHRAQLPEPLAAALAADGAALTGDVAVRFASATCVAGLCRSAAGLEHLRARGAGEVLRAWLADEHDEDTRLGIDAAMQALASSEGQAPGAADDAPAPTSSGDGGEKPASPAVGDAPPVIGPGPLPPRDAGAASGGDEDVADLFAGIEDGEAKR